MKPFKVMLDECITLRCAQTIIDYLQLLSPPVEAHFLVTYIGHQGALDGDWSLLLQPPEDWVVISSDAGRSGPRIHAKGPPLHLILPKRSITSFFLRGRSLTQVPGAERARVVITKLPRILELADTSIPGSRYKISRAGAGFNVDTWTARPSDYQ